MTTFLALYRGPTVASAELIAISIDDEIIADVARRILREPDPTGEGSGDLVRKSLNDGRRRALEAIVTEAMEGTE
jgi:hypothetical protein